MQVLAIHLWDILRNPLDSRVAAVGAVILIVTIILRPAMERLAGVSHPRVRPGSGQRLAASHR